MERNDNELNKHGFSIWHISCFQLCLVWCSHKNQIPHHHLAEVQTANQLPPQMNQPVTQNRPY